MLTLILLAAAALIVWSVVVLVSPIGQCGRCKGQRVIIRGRRSRRCPRCQGRGLCRRRGAVVVHRLVQNIAAERKRAADPPSRPPAAAWPPAPPARPVPPVPPAELPGGGPHA